MEKLKYKLGAQLDYGFDPEASIDKEDKFEWNLCILDSRGFTTHYVYLGVRTTRDPIIAKARELVKLLNE